MEAHVLRIVSRGKTPAAGRLEHLPKLWLHAPVRFELACAAPEDTEAALDDTPTYSISIHSLDASRNPVDSPLVWYAEVDAEGNTNKSKGPHAVFELSAADIANVTEAGEYWLAFHAYSGGERIVRAAGYLTFADDGFPTDPPTPTPPGTVYLTQAAGDARYVRDPGTVADNRIVRWDGVSGNTVQSSLVTVDDSGNVSTPGTLTVSSISATGGISASWLQVFGTTWQVDLSAENLTQDRTFEFPDTPSGVLAATTNVNGAPDRMEIYAKCDEAGGVTLGQAVYIYGANGGNKLIRKAIASGEPTSSKTLGFVSQALAHNAFGNVVTEGPVAVSIAKGSAVEGDPVWLSPSTAGGVVFGAAAKPSAPNHMVFMGYVTRITGADVTEIFVKVQNGFELEELHNVAIATPSTGQTIFWNGTLWANRAIGASDFGGTATNGYVLTVVGGNPQWAAATGGGGTGVTDGDKGDITVTGTGTVWTIDNGAVTNNKLADGAVANSKLASMLSSTIKGSLVGGTPIDLTAAEATSILNAFSGTIKGLVPASPGGSTVFLNGNGAWSNITPSTISGSTTVGQALMVAVDAAAGRTALGLGTLATQSGTFSGTSSGTNTGDVTLATSVSSVLELSGQQLRAVTDPPADRILFFDQSAGAMAYATLGSCLSTSGTTLNVTLETPGPIGGTTPGEGTFNQLNARTSLEVQATTGAGGPLRVWNTGTDTPTDWERASMAWSSNVFILSTQRNGSGVAREMEISPGGIPCARFTTDGRLRINSATLTTGNIFSVKSSSTVGTYATIRVESRTSTASTVEIGTTGGGNGFITILSGSGNIDLQAGTSYFPGNLNAGQTSGNAARMHIKGSGTTSSTTALRVDNSSGTARFTVRDDGAFAFAGGTVAVADTGWTDFTNLTTDKTCDANATTVEELADILGTLIVALKNKGIIAN